MEKKEIHEFRNLDSKDMAMGIGRKATDEELINYLLKDKDSKALPPDEAFVKYLTKKKPL